MVRPLPPEHLGAAASGFNIDDDVTVAQVIDQPAHTTLVVFLRHYG